MKKSTIYRRAAEIAAHGTRGWGDCIMLVGGTKKMERNFADLYLDPVWTNLAYGTTARVLALLFMAEIARDDEAAGN